ncbi:60S ribosomal protein L23a-like [Hippopotamus amphibius kiboko]|uniref:60S ribosomal protein L23a-like n=1 Tax=Hippopotamus amphibius kiboko TaxID=575201 RepID=UPI0025937ADD|nr:60S ribosomal protein L23a-like [Hippopotamus amphibius kiboko]
MSPTFQGPKTLRFRRQPKYPQKSTPRRNKLHLYTIITTEVTMKKREDHSTPVFIVEVKANEHQIEQTVKRLYDVAKVNILTRPDGEKKVYVHLVPNCDALDVADEIEIT